MTSLRVPRNLEEITPRWLTDALHSKDATRSARVIRVSAETITGGKGFMNQVARLEPQYEGDPTALPGSIIAKLPSADPLLKNLSERLGHQRREVSFYQHLAGRGPLRTPKSYYSYTDPTTGNTVVLLEDMTWARQGDSVAGCSLADARLCLSELAKFHASWWGNPCLDRLEWVPLKDGETGDYQEVYADAWKSLVEKSEEGMRRGLRLVGERLAVDIPKIKTTLTRHPRTMVHGDYRLDNCFFPDSPGYGPLTVIDWEFCTRSRGVHDVATFVSEAFSPGQRRDHEVGLLRSYHNTLISCGVSGYSFEECLDDYRLSMMEVLVFWVVTGGHCNFDGLRAKRYLYNTLQRLETAISDLACTEMLSA